MTTNATSLSAVPAFAESTLASLLRGFSKECTALWRVERDVEYFQDKVEEFASVLADLKAGLADAEERKRGVEIARAKLEREARRLGADDDDILEAVRISYRPEPL